MVLGLLHHWWEQRVGGHRSARTGHLRRSARRQRTAIGRNLGEGRLSAGLEALENRRLLATTTPGADVSVLDAEVLGANRVAVSYKIGDNERPNQTAEANAELTIGLYRSADDRFDPADQLVGSTKLDVRAAGDGPTETTIVAPDGLPPNPSQPFVLAVADPNNALAEADETNNTAAIRKRIIGVVTHGGVQGSSYPPAWAVRLSQELEQIGYDTVITYTWAAESQTPGAAAKQGPRVANMVLHSSLLFSQDEPVDLHLIGHSEGTVVNSQALLHLERFTTPQLSAGFVKATMLDPHAANNNAPGQHDSSGGFLGWLADQVIHTFQNLAKDPIVVIPKGVDDAEVFFQHTPHGVSSSEWSYNLWGQAPVIGQANHCDITGPGMAHTGVRGVQAWYYFNVLPTLSGGGSFVCPSRLTGQPRRAPGAQQLRQSIATANATPEFTGTSAPGATVRLIAESAAEPGFAVVDETTADPDGSWTLTSRPLPTGSYRLLVKAVVPAGEGPWTTLHPMLPMGRWLVHPNAEQLGSSSERIRALDSSPADPPLRDSLRGPTGLVPSMPGRLQANASEPPEMFTPRVSDRVMKRLADRLLR